LQELANGFATFELFLRFDLVAAGANHIESTGIAVGMGKINQISYDNVKTNNQTRIDGGFSRKQAKKARDKNLRITKSKKTQGKVTNRNAFIAVSSISEYFPVNMPLGPFEKPNNMEFGLNDLIPSYRPVCEHNKNNNTTPD
jgi:hypothetical protein